MNISPQFYRDPLSSAAGGASAFSPIGAVAAGAQVVTGLIQAVGGSKDMKKAKAKRKAYEIPDEIYNILNATMSRMGGDAQTLNYETNQITQAGAANLGVAARLGADPNQLSALLEQQTNALSGAAQRNHAAAMENFGRVIQGYNLLADNKAAKWKSEQDIVKDDMQAADAKMKSGMQNIAGGVNTAISVDSATRAGNLYKERTATIGDLMSTGGTAAKFTNSGVVTPELARALITNSPVGAQTTGNPYITPLVEADKVNKMKTIWGTSW